MGLMNYFQIDIFIHNIESKENGFKGYNIIRNYQDF